MCMIYRSVVLFILYIDLSFINSTGANRIQSSFILVYPYYYRVIIYIYYSLVYYSEPVHICTLYNSSQGGVRNDPIQLGVIHKKKK